MQDLTTLTINVKDPWKDPANGWDVAPAPTTAPWKPM